VGDLAGTAYPPPVNNFSIAGDMFFNTAEPFNIGKTYDLFSVAMHEFGHAVGLGLSNAYGSVENAAYKMRTGLGSDDIAGVRAIYSQGLPRSTESYLGLNSTFLTATPVGIDPSALTGQVDNLNLATAGQAEYFSVVVPSGTNGNFTATVQSAGLSLLAPAATVYNSNLAQVGYTSGAGQYGTTISVNLTGVSAGQIYYVKVTGADTSAFGTGAYALTLNLGSGPSPKVPLPNTQTPNGNPLQAGGGSPQAATPADVNDSLAGQVFNPAQQTINEFHPIAFFTTLPASAATQHNPAIFASGSTALSTTETLTLGPIGRSSEAGRADGRIESGGGGAVETTTDLSLPDKMPPASEPSNTEPLPAPDKQVAQTFSSKAGWQEACTACFAKEAAQRLSGEETTSGLAVAKSEAFDPAAALVGSVLILGGYWGSQSEQIPERTRRKGKL